MRPYRNADRRAWLWQTSARPRSLGLPETLCRFPTSHVLNLFFLQHLSMARASDGQPAFLALETISAVGCQCFTPIITGTVSASLRDLTMSCVVDLYFRKWGVSR